MKRINLFLLAIFCALAVGCRREDALSTEEMVGEWQKATRSLPPVNLLITAEGTELRARLRLSGAESRGRVSVDGSHFTVKFEDDRAPLEGDFLTKTELRLRAHPNGEAYVLRKRP